MLRPSIFISATYVTGVVAQAGALSHALVKRLQLLVVVGIIETEHRDDVIHRLEALDRPARDALRGRVGR